MNLHIPLVATGLAGLGMKLLESMGGQQGTAANDPGFANPRIWSPMVARLRASPVSDSDAALFRLQQRYELSDAELVCAAIAMRLECDPYYLEAARQHGATGPHARLLAGQVATAFGLGDKAMAELTAGQACRIGLLVLGIEDGPLPERSLSIPQPVLGALLGHDEHPEMPPTLGDPDIRFTTRQKAELAQIAAWAVAGPQRTVMLRGADRGELRAAAWVLARSVDCTAIACESGKLPASAWLTLRAGIPVVEMQDHEDRKQPDQPHRNGMPLVLLCDHDMPRLDHDLPVREYRLETLSVDDRAALWRDWGLDAEPAAKAARRYRQGAGAIARAAGNLPGGDAKDADVLAAIAAGVAEGNLALDALARRAPVRDIGEDALVLPAHLHEQLALLRQRILAREELGNGLGPALTARYRPGVRALMTGESGTGKTLAAHWLAARLGLPLYRADMAALTSKWIGETEKNLSRLLSLAEASDCILFFDEADALFGARTDVSDSNDRHANAQTNFLLQRIEDFDGIAVLSTNSRDRFDRAFVRRLDAILEFPLPDAAARIGLWRAHLGESHALPAGAIERLAQDVELAGGHIRNAVLGAALRARIAEEPIGLDHIYAALDEECDKLGHPRPGRPG